MSKPGIYTCIYYTCDFRSVPGDGRRSYSLGLEERCLADKWKHLLAKNPCSGSTCRIGTSYVYAACVWCCMSEMSRRYNTTCIIDIFCIITAPRWCSHAQHKSGKILWQSYFWTPRNRYGQTSTESTLSFNLLSQALFWPETSSLRFIEVTWALAEVVAYKRDRTKHIKTKNLWFTSPSKSKLLDLPDAGSFGEPAKSKRHRNMARKSLGWRNWYVQIRDPKNGCSNFWASTDGQVGEVSLVELGFFGLFHLSNFSLSNNFLAPLEWQRSKW